MNQHSTTKKSSSVNYSNFRRTIHPIRYTANTVLPVVIRQNVIISQTQTPPFLTHLDSMSAKSNCTESSENFIRGSLAARTPVVQSKTVSDSLVPAEMEFPHACSEVSVSTDASALIRGSTAVFGVGLRAVHIPPGDPVI